MGEITAEVMISVDNGPQVPGTIVVEQEWIDVTSATATKPDPAWEFHDAAGHFHAYDVDGKLPTLEPRSRHIDCPGEHVSPEYDDDDCEGYDVVEYFCPICDEMVEPRRLDDSGTKTIPGRKSWTATVRTEVPRDTKVTVRAVDAIGGVYFGIAYASGNVSMEGDARGVRVTTQLYGAGPLGRRAISAAVAA